MSATAPHETALGSLRLVVEDRGQTPGGGPALRVYGADGRQLLRFDCFAQGAHWHLDPDGRDERAGMGRGEDPVAWTVGKLRGELGDLLAQVGVREPLPPEQVGPALIAVERALEAARSGAQVGR